MFVCVVIFSNADAVLTVSAQYCHRNLSFLLCTASALLKMTRRRKKNQMLKTICGHYLHKEKNSVPTLLHRFKESMSEEFEILLRQCVCSTESVLGTVRTNMTMCLENHTSL